jgi:hypothetical protein
MTRPRITTGMFRRRPGKRKISTHCSNLGGKLADDPEHRQRKYADKRRTRTFFLRTMIFYGHGHHYHCTLTKDANAIIYYVPDPEKPGYEQEWEWSPFDDDPQHQSEVMLKRFNKAEEIAPWVAQCAKRWGIKKYRVEVDDLTGEHAKWFYRDGD